MIIEGQQRHMARGSVRLIPDPVAGAFGLLEPRLYRERHKSGFPSCGLLSSILISEPSSTRRIHRCDQRSPPVTPHTLLTRSPAMICSIGVESRTTVGKKERAFRAIAVAVGK